MFKYNGTATTAAAKKPQPTPVPWQSPATVTGASRFERAPFAGKRQTVVEDLSFDEIPAAPRPTRTTSRTSTSHESPSDEAEGGRSGSSAKVKFGTATAKSTIVSKVTASGTITHKQPLLPKMNKRRTEIEQEVTLNDDDEEEEPRRTMKEKRAPPPQKKGGLRKSNGGAGGLSQSQDYEQGSGVGSASATAEDANGYGAIGRMPIKKRQPTAQKHQREPGCRGALTRNQVTSPVPKVVIILMETLWTTFPMIHMVGSPMATTVTTNSTAHNT